jgi:hypothetical protein
MDFEKAMKNPAAVFGTPETLYAATELSPDQKRAILLQWRDQIEQFQHADDENMRAPGPPTGMTAECLRRVSDLLLTLEARP